VTFAPELEALLAQVVAHHVQNGVVPPLDALTVDRPELAAPLRALVEQYLEITRALDDGPSATARAGSETTLRLEPGQAPRPGSGQAPRPGSGRAPRPGSGQAADQAARQAAFPDIEGFRTIERIGAGGMGTVYKLQDLRLNRIVAAKVVSDAATAGDRTRLAAFLREARSLALFSDPRIVQVFEVRADSTPPVIIMEHVDGFELGRVAASLEFRQRAAIMRDVADAMHRAHTLGLQHRDLKPSNIMVDDRLRPKILDFGLSSGDPTTGHFVGTVRYIAPEQLDSTQPIDARTDVYALGVILYELLTGEVPFRGATDSDIIAAIRSGQPRLPVEIDPRVPAPLQAIALKAMERRPEDRYATARDLVLDLDRYLERRPVLARPTLYGTTLAARTRPHLDQIAEWLRLRLIYPHEAAELHAAYRRLDAREDDWIVASRALTPSQIALYLGAFFLFAGSLFYFVAHRVYDAASGTVWPFIVLGAPFLGLNLAGRWLYRRDHQAVAVAFYLAGASLLPLFLLIWFHETGWWVVPENTPGQLFTEGSISNRQLQVTIGLSCVWASWLALRTKTAALSTVATVLACLLALAILGDLGLRIWLEDARYDKVAMALFPLVPIYLVAALALERGGRLWFARPVAIAAAIAFVAVVDLLSLDGRLFHYLGVSTARLQAPGVTDPTLLDTLTALSLNGAAFYFVALLLERRGTPALAIVSPLLITIAPFSLLEPLAYLTETAEYSRRFNWLYLGLAIGIALVSQERQRKSFYYAGLLNSGLALYLIADRYQWFNRVGWALSVVAAGLFALSIGFLLDIRRQRRGA
jgi:serine/threonine protein kinase